MGKPNKLVAVCVNISGGCEYVALVKNIDESEYAELLYEQRQHEQERKQKDRELKETIEELHSEIEKILITDTLVEDWIYPLIQPKLIEEARCRGFL